MKRYCFPLAFVFLAAFLSASGQQQSAVDSARIKYYRDYAIISTSCTTWEDAQKTADAIVRKGGVVSVMLSPQYFLGWVPDSAKTAMTF